MRDCILMKPYLYVHRKSRFASKKSVKKIESKNLNRKHIFLRIISKKKYILFCQKVKKKYVETLGKQKYKSKRKRKEKKDFIRKKMEKLRYSAMD